MSRNFPLFAIASLWVLCIALMLLVYNTHPQGAGDYSYYYGGAQRILNGYSLYEAIDPKSDYVGPPLIIQMVLPFVSIADFQGSANLWFVLNIAAVFGSTYMLAQALESRRSRYALWIAMAFSMPMFFSMWLGQVTPIMMLFTVGGWYTYRKGYPVITGVLLAIIVWTKFYPGLLLVYFVLKREWRVVVCAGFATVSVILFQMMLVGLDGFVAFFRDVLPPLLAEGQIQINHSNSSVLGFAQRLFTPSPQVILLTESPFLTMLTRYGLTALLFGSVIFFSTKHSMRKTPTTQFDLEYSLTLVVAMLLGSTLGYHSLISSMLPMVVLYLAVRKSPVMKRRTLMYTFLAYMLINVHLFIMVGQLEPGSNKALSALALSLPFFGMMILWALLVNIHLKASAKSNAQSVEIPSTAVTT